MNTYDHNQDPLTVMHIDAKWVEHSHAYSHKMGERVKKNDISELIQNKDPLGLNSNIESYTTIKSTTKPAEAITPEEDTQTKMECDAILHYLKLAVTFNNSADNKGKDEITPPTWQVNNPIRPLHSVSSGNLARSTMMSFKSFENIQQSHRRSHTNSWESTSDGNPGTSSDINLTIRSKSNKLNSIRK